MAADPPSTSPVLTRAALNRALLARQHLLARTPAGAVDVLRDLVGVQAQNTTSPYVGLWSRVEGFRHADVGDALLERRVARIAVMRGTIHLLTRVDALLLPELTRPLFARDLAVNSQHAAALRTVDLAEVGAAARALVERSPRTTTELGRLLAVRWPQVAPSTLAYAARGLLALVQVPPRGMWGRSAPTTWTTTDAWWAPTGAAPGPVDVPVALEALARRFLAAFGPASVADLRQWSGLTGWGPVVERLRPDLVTFRAEPGPGARHGRELLDLPDAPRPPADVPAPVRYLPDYDNVTLAYADKGRMIDDADRGRLASPNGVLPGTVLLDGRVGGTWRVRRARVGGPDRSRDEVATLEVEPFRAVSRSLRRELAAEGERLVRFVADDAVDHRVVVS